MRISDWSSDVCSSDLLSCGFYAGFRYLKDCGKFLVTVDRLRQLSENEPAVTASVFVQFHNGMTRRAAASEEVQNDGVRVVPGRSEQAIVDSPKALREGKRRSGNQFAKKTGRASGRERGCQDVSTLVGAVPLKKKQKNNKRQK